MARLFKSKLVNENSFMHALGGLVVGSLRGNCFYIYTSENPSICPAAVGGFVTLYTHRSK